MDGDRTDIMQQIKLNKRLLCLYVVAASLIFIAVPKEAIADAMVSAVSDATPLSPGPPPNRTLGFVVKDFMPAVYETKFMDECPAGLNISNDEIWWRNLSKEDRSELTQDGLITTLDRWFFAVRRGPNGEDVCINPELITDDPPLLTVEGSTAFGVNLDGNVDGSATPKTCSHENFTSPDGEPGIDNQLYRLIGCIYGYREQGVIDINANEMRRTSGLAMILIEVTDVDDARNDDDVTVTFYRSIDQFPLDSSGQVMPYSSYRVDYTSDGARYGDSIKGSIVDGVLIAGSGDVRLPYYGNYNYMHPVIKDLQIELNISENGETAVGMLAGYYDLEQYLYLTGGLGPVISTGNFSCPAFFNAAKRLADGYPDPQTGECTHISSVFDITAFAAFVVHPDISKEVETAGR